MQHIHFGVKKWSSDVLIVSVECGGVREYTAWDLIWLVPMVVFFCAFVAFAIMFYWMFPHQMVWLIPGLIVVLLMR